MNTKILIVGIGLLLLGACKKNECHECHYEKMVNGVETEIELGEKCDEELENLEKDGFKESDGTTYEVHCHGH